MEEMILAFIGPIIQILYDEIKKCIDRNSPIKKELRDSIENLIYEWEETWKIQEESLYNKYISWHEHEKEINEWVEKLSKEKPISDETFDEIFHWTINKVKSLSDLIKRQIEWYGNNLDLSNQLNKEKEILIKQLREDLDTYFWIINSIAEKEAKKHWWANIDDIEISEKMIKEFKEWAIQDASHLIDQIIKKVSVK